MRRRMPEDGSLYRARVTKRRSCMNPDYDWRSDDPAKRARWIYKDDDTYVDIIGPYTTPGALKGQVTANLFGYAGELHESVVGFELQQANIVWEEFRD